MPKISVILTSFNHEKFICEALDSIINQTFTDFELIILDDASSDSSWELIKQYSDPRIKAFRSDGAGEVTQHLNNAISGLAVGEYIAIHHSDDVWELDKLEKQTAFLEAHPEVGAVFTWVQMINEHGAQLTNDWFNQENKTRWQWLNELFFEHNHLSHPSVLIRKQCYQEVGLYRLSLYQTPDAEMWSRVLIKFPIHVIQEKLTKHRRFTDKSNVSGDKIASVIRANNEWNVLRANCLSVTNFEDIIAIFPSLERFKNPQGFDNKFLLAMACLNECKLRNAWQLGLTWLFELINDETRFGIINKLYSFSHVDLFKLTGKFDVYFTRGEKLIADRDAMVAAKDAAIAAKDATIAEQNATINVIYASSSWKLTQPLRFLVQLKRNPKSLISEYLQPCKPSDTLPDARSDTLPINLADAPSDTLFYTPYKSETLPLGIDHKILLVAHEFSRTGAPYAVLYLARAIFSLYGIKPAVIFPEDGPIREELEQEGFPTIVDPLLFNYQNYSSEACNFVASFERVIVTSLAAFGFIRYFRGIGKRLTWWIHETDEGFITVTKMITDLPLLFAACESIWLGSPLCFPCALDYAPEDKLHLLLYGCEDTAILHRRHMSGKMVFSIVGSVVPRKGQDTFLAAIERLPEQLRAKAVFRIIGSPLPYEESALFYEKVLAKAELIPEVECIESMTQDKLLEFYAETDVLVSASRDDPMPITITQGLMFSKVCLCSSSIGHAQLLEDGNNGLIFTNQSAEELSDKMAWLLQNPDEIAAIGAAGRAIYEKHFLISSFIKNLGNLMRDYRLIAA